METLGSEFGENTGENDKWNTRWFKENDVILFFGAWLFHTYDWIYYFKLPFHV